MYASRTLAIMRLLHLNTSPFDPSIDAVSELLVKKGVISGSFNEIAAGNRNQKRHRFTKFLFLLYATVTFRSALYFVARAMNHDTLVMLSGDYFSTVKLGGDILSFWTGACSFLALVWSVVVYRAELNYQLDIMTDFRNVRGEALVAKHLTGTTFRKWKLQTKFVAMFITSFRYGIHVVGYLAHFYCVYATHQANQNYWYTGYLLVWYAIFMFWLHYVCDMFSSALAFLYLSAVYLKMRFAQVNEKISHITMQQCDRKLLSQHVQTVITEHNALSNVVPLHGHVAKWVLFGLDYVCCWIVAVSLTAPTYGQFDSVLFKCAIYGASAQLLGAMVFFGSVAGGVHKQVSR